MPEKWSASAHLADIDQSGFPDLVVTQTRGTINLEAVTHVYLAEAPFQYPEAPTATFTSGNAIAAPRMLDVNGDGYLDAVVISVPFGVRNIVNYFVRRKIAVVAQVYIFRDGAFGEDPDFKTTITMEAPDGREEVAYTMGDFTGDGLLDVAYGKGESLFVVQAGEAKDFLESRRWAEFEIPSFGVARPHDLDGQGGKDIILHHPGGKRAKRVDLILF